VVLEEADLVIFAAPAAVTRALAPAVVEAGIAIIDVGGALLDMGVIAVPLAGVSVDPETFADRRVVCSPSAPAVLAAVVLRPLTTLGLSRAHITTLLPAGVVGRSGAEELSRQVVALFNSSDPPRSVFPDGLAFDVVGALGTPTDDWTGAERRMSLELAALLRVPPPHLPSTLVFVPTFAGLSMSIVARLAQGVGAEQVRSALDAIPLVEVADPPKSPQSTVGSASAYVGRIRDDPGGDGVHLWATADNLRFGASANVIAIAAQLWRQNLL
jgi:aspartate-semialdehyde dehydrogenase